MSTDLSTLDSNLTVNMLDKLLAEGNHVNSIVSAMDDIRVLANYGLLVQKGATNIDLARIRDSVEPSVIMNNLLVFKHANIPVNISNIVYEMLDRDAYDMSLWDVADWTALGANPQVLADKYIASYGLDTETVTALLDAGAHIDGNKVVEKLLADDEYLIEHFYADNDLRVLKRANASPELVQKLLKRVSKLTVANEQATYGGPYPDTLDIIEDGPQVTKIFYEPQIQIIAPEGGRELPVDWAGRILPGQTVSDGVAADIQEVYGYTGKIEWRDPYFSKWIKDNHGTLIQRYGMYVTLLPDEAHPFTMSTRSNAQ